MSSATLKEEEVKKDIYDFYENQSAEKNLSACPVLSQLFY